VEQGRGCRAEAEDNAIVGDRIGCQWSVAAVVLYTDGETLGNRKRERRKTKGMAEMRQVSWDTSLICLFRYFRVSEGKGEGEDSGL